MDPKEKAVKEAKFELEKKFFKEKRLPALLCTACTLGLGQLFGISSMIIGAAYAPIFFVGSALCTGGMSIPIIATGDFLCTYFMPAEKLMKAYLEAKQWEKALPICVYMFLRSKRSFDKSETEALEKLQDVKDAAESPSN